MSYEITKREAMELNRHERRKLAARNKKGKIPGSNQPFRKPAV